MSEEPTAFQPHRFGELRARRKVLKFGYPVCSISANPNATTPVDLRFGNVVVGLDIIVFGCSEIDDLAFDIFVLCLGLILLRFASTRLVASQGDVVLAPFGNSTERIRIRIQYE